MLVTAAEFTPMLWYIYEWMAFEHEKKLGFYPLGVDMNMKVCIACDFCYPSSNMYNFEQVLHLLADCVCSSSSAESSCSVGEHKGGMMSKGMREGY